MRELEERHQHLMDLLGATVLKGGSDSHRGTSATGGEGVRYRDRIAVLDEDRFLLLRVKDIHWIESARNYLLLHCSHATFTIRSTLARLEAELDPAMFARIHRSQIVNLDPISEIRSGRHSDFDVVLHSGKELRLSRTYRERVLPRER